MSKELGVIKDAKFGMIDHYKAPILSFTIAIYGGEFLAAIGSVKMKELYIKYKIPSTEWFVGKLCVVANIDAIYSFVDLYDVKLSACGLKGF